jgi:hypothetical protein
MRYLMIGYGLAAVGAVVLALSAPPRLDARAKLWLR